MSEPPDWRLHLKCVASYLEVVRQMNGQLPARDEFIGTQQEAERAGWEQLPIFEKYWKTSPEMGWYCPYHAARKREADEL